jgi:hypothetical protein
MMGYELGDLLREFEGRYALVSAVWEFWDLKFNVSSGLFGMFFTYDRRLTTYNI